MYRITIVHDPSVISPPEIYEVEGGILGDWILSHYGNNGFDVHTEIFSGCISDQSLIFKSGDKSTYHSFDSVIDDNLFILHTPAGAQIAYAVIAAIVVAALMPTPTIPGALSQKQSTSSPNNAFTGQTNVARTTDRVPEIFGTVRAFPDLIAPSAFEFINDIKYITEFLCVGRGFYSLTDIRSGNTLINDIPNSVLEIYNPNDSIPTYPLTNQSNEVSGQVLLAPNQGSVTLDSNYQLRYDVVNDIGKIQILQGVDAWSLFSISDNVTLTDITGNDFNVDGNYVVENITIENDPGVGLYYIIEFTDAALENPNWTNFFSQIDAGTPLDSSSGGVTLTPTVALPDTQIGFGPFEVPGQEIDEIWVDLQAPRGLARGGQLNQLIQVEINFFIEEIDSFGTPTGYNFNYNVVLSGADVDPRFWTFKITSVDGLLPNTLWRISATRITDALLNTTSVEEIQWTRLAGIDNLSYTDETGTTRVILTTRASEQVANAQERKFNLNAQRQCLTYDGFNVVGDLNTGIGLTPSNRFADAFLTYALDPRLANRNQSQIDLDTLYDIQDSLDVVFNGEKGEFSYTFDQKNSPAIEEMVSICRACRVILIREGSNFSFSRDEEQLNPMMMFNRRNKLPNSESKTLNFNRPDDFDGVLLEYNSNETDKVETITLPNDLPNTDPNFGLPNTLNPIRSEAIGIRNYSQAWDRAQFELNRLIYQRENVETVVTPDGAFAPLNARIIHTDGTRIDPSMSDGEIVEIDGLTITTDNECVFDGINTYSVILRDNEGNISTALPVLERNDSGFGFILQNAPPFTIFTRSGDAQKGTLYEFAADVSINTNTYLIQRKSLDDYGNVKMELINYDERYYQADNQIPP